MKEQERETLKKFIQVSINNYESPFYNLSFLKFVFTKEFIKKLEEYLDLDYDRNKVGIDILKRNLLEYNNRDEYDNNNYIVVNDYNTFFMLLNKIYRYNPNLMNTIWLRMGANDLLDVNSFLLKQVSFLNNSLCNDKYNYIGEFDNLRLMCKDDNNDDYFETNKHIQFTFEKETYEYAFPVIHYALDKNVCYIYGIQSLTNQKNDEEIKIELQKIRKNLRNKSVSAEFIMALKMFIELLKSKGIYDIKVPLLQIFNYPYHEEISQKTEYAYSLYTEEEKEKYRKMYEENIINDAMFDFIHTEMVFNRFYEKQDIISKNKTERLIDIFMIMEEKFNNISIISDPFIESEELLIKIKKV